MAIESGAKKGESESSNNSKEGEEEQRREKKVSGMRKEWE